MLSRSRWWRLGSSHDNQISVINAEQLRNISRGDLFYWSIYLKLINHLFLFQPIFDSRFPSIVDVAEGQTALLTCRAFNRNNKTVRLVMVEGTGGQCDHDSHSCQGFCSLQSHFIISIGDIMQNYRVHSVRFSHRVLQLRTQLYSFPIYVFLLMPSLTSLEIVV